MFSFKGKRHAFLLFIVLTVHIILFSVLIATSSKMNNDFQQMSIWDTSPHVAWWTQWPTATGDNPCHPWRYIIVGVYVVLLQRLAVSCKTRFHAMCCVCVRNLALLCRHMAAFLVIFCLLIFVSRVVAGEFFFVWQEFKPSLLCHIIILKLPQRSAVAEYAAPCALALSPSYLKIVECSKAKAANITCYLKYTV